MDKTSEKTGIRSFSFDAKNGFVLNGKAMKLKGGCVHHDNGPLGARAYDRAEYRRVELLKASGYNAIRTSHNPPSPAFLSACDELGMLVIEEAFDTWNENKKPYDYHHYFNQWWKKDIMAMIERDRNHPSVIVWSIGNEIPNMEKKETADVAKMLADFVRGIDNTRPVTAAVHNLDPNKDAFFSTLDIKGYNYGRAKYVEDHQRLPERVMYGSESFPIEAFDYWMVVEDNTWVVGDFVWTAFDYIGEASIGWLGYWQKKNFYPWNLAYCGDIDICGWKRPQSFYRDVLWKKNQLSVFVHPPVPSFPHNPDKEAWSVWHWEDVVADWNWKPADAKTLAVDVYSSCEEVELMLNGKSLGKKPTNRSTKFIATFDVPNEQGELKAVGYNNGKEAETKILSTAAAPAQLKLTADRKTLKADGQDLCYVTVEVVDKNGVRHPKADNLLEFELQGERHNHFHC
ncbi:MAG: glycoside hydrolase family 2 protein [Bacteroidia bacterium]|nr:glycoside hydrolase family 2 protein [Bacteroidia bacterium]